ncbi:hypothetical protein [Qingshengfaniella alkalisoli]|uniref:Uncharacterized protein n=1 Tax=Qingshengfaniella alkalisoli TaxID=2599296 RepID=A0A5B8IVI4_9RHOB|nr:hypothetical protein [Qingshengfaniella alkalisoli]QDY70122.1 hypothetical protein FPZ52_11150 [Qingshengfaniella alkalisoli]
MSSQQQASPNGAGGPTATPSGTRSTLPDSSFSDAKTSSPDRDKRAPESQPKDWGAATDDERAGAIDALLRGEQPEGTDKSDDQGDPERGQERDQGDPDPWMPEDAENDADGQEDVPDGDAKPVTIKDAAERLGLDAEAFYGLEVTTGDGETVKLGDLKDAWQDREAEARETAKRAKALDERESALTADQMFWDQFQQYLEPQLTPKVKAALRGRYEAHQQQQGRALLNAMPELKDPVARENFESMAVKVRKELGYSDQEPMRDYREALALRRLIRAEARLDKLMSYEPDRQPPKASKPKGKGDSGKVRRSQMMQRAKAGNDFQKVSAISELLKG